MPPSRDEDLDWLYGRDRPQPSQPEPTRVMPAPFAAAPPPNPANTPVGERSDLPAGYPPMPAYPGALHRSPEPTPPGAAPPPPAGPTGPGWPPTTSPGGQPAKKRRPVRRVLRVLLILLLVMLGWLIAVPAYAWTQIERVDDAPAGDRPANQPGKTFLLVGSDSREGLTKAEQKRLGTGNVAGQRTDTIMILYVPPGGKPALISLPRDSYLDIPGNGKNKLNAAYAFGGPKLLVHTVEQNTGLRVDGYLEIGFGGFVNIIDALGGIRMCLPAAIKDRDSHINLPKGCQNLGGTDALGYVRMRKADPRGDLGRVERQRQMLAAVAREGASPSSVLNPVRYWRLCNAVADSIKLGKDTTLFEMVSLGLAMKKISGDKGLTLTVPIANPGASTPVGSAVLWDDAKARAMFSDIARGDTSQLAKYAK